MVGIPMTETLTCYPSGCAGCRHRTDGGCELMALLGGHDAVEINAGGSARAQHPIDAYIA